MATLVLREHRCGWIHSPTRYVILLSNSVHPHLKAAITPLRSRVASVAAAGLDLPEVGAQAVLSSDVRTQPIVAAEARG